MNRSTKKIISSLVGLSMAASVPAGAYWAFDEGLLGADHSDRTASQALVNLDKAELQAQVQQAADLEQARIIYEAEWNKAIEDAFAKGMNREQAFDAAAPYQSLLNQSKDALDQLTADFNRNVFGNMTLSENYLQNVTYDFRQAAPNSSVNEDLARYIDDCQVSFVAERSEDRRYKRPQQVLDCAVDKEANTVPRHLNDVLGNAAAPLFVFFLIGSSILTLVAFPFGYSISQGGLKKLEDRQARKKAEKKSKQKLKSN